ncbi:TPA: fimbrial protein [Salmonella enterica]|nr:fimbrial protein [Salmonella enterica]
MTTMTRWKMLLLLLCGGMIAGVDAGGTKTVELQLHLVVTQPPPCTVDDVNVPLRAIHQSDVDNYEQSFTIPINCNDSDGHHIKLQIQGTTVAYSEAVLQTSHPELGISLLQDDRTPLLVGASGGAVIDLYIENHHNHHDLPLIAKLVRENTAEKIAPGTYSTSATLLLEYP